MPTTLDVLREAERFISGFKDDEVQKGINNKLARLRQAIDLEEKRAALSIPKASRAALIKAARDLYAQSSDDSIEIDDDAQFSQADTHTWVSAWVCVNHEELNSKHRKALTSVASFKTNTKPAHPTTQN